MFEQAVSVADIARRTNHARETVSSMLSGKYKMTPDVARAIAAATRRSQAELFGDDAA